MNPNEFSLSELEKVPDCQGIYIWYLKLKYFNPPKREDALVKLEQLIKANNSDEIKLTASKTLHKRVKFNEQYEAFAKRSKIIELDLNILLEKIELILPIFNNNCLPLYIGKSKTLQSRIKRHFKYYNQFNTINPFEENILFDEEMDDNDIESKFFGQRLAIMNMSSNNKKWFNENEIVIKIYELNQIKYDELSQIELFLNYSIRPLLGIK